MNEPHLAYFNAIPWCSSIINDKDFLVTPTFSRRTKPNDEDSLTAETLQSSRTINACLSVYRRPPPDTQWINEVRTLMSIGSGLNGGPNMLHGGMIATVLDDTIGTLLTVNMSNDGRPLTDNNVTVELNVKYSRPVATPQTIVVVATRKESRGSKMYMEAEIRDGRGKILAKAESVWMPFKPRTGLKL